MRTGLRLRQFGSLPSASLLLGRRSPVRSIQRGTVTVAGVTSNTATIVAVDMTNSILRLLGLSGSGSNMARSFVRLIFTDATTITGAKGEAGDSAVASFEVIEYWPGVIRQVQRNTVDMAGAAATGTYTISPALQNIAKASVDNLGVANADPTVPDANHCLTRLTLTNTTTVTGTRLGTQGAVSVGCQIVEYW